MCSVYMCICVCVCVCVHNSLGTLQETGRSLSFTLPLQLKHCRVGQTVRVTDDLSTLYQLQSDYMKKTEDDMFTVCDA